MSKESKRKGGEWGRAQVKEGDNSEQTHPEFEDSMEAVIPRGQQLNRKAPESTGYHGTSAASNFAPSRDDVSVMIEPDSPVTLKVNYPLYPAFLLASDEVVASAGLLVSGLRDRTTMLSEGLENTFVWMTMCGPLEVTYQWRSLRTRGDKTRGETTSWFASRSSQLLDVPPVLPQAVIGDLYVHASDNDIKQAWIRTAEPAWLSIELLHPHPYLRGYVLNFQKNGEPSWVTKDTVRTYRGRVQKLAREAKEGNIDFSAWQ
ncbi:hypothetical protein C8Q80DRAFT_1124705 [Daedaleopsis nitida]|nr:hypothetical protein C8Q80DRAFT_1124705 [Daedaleopsis nitida]